VYRHRQLFTLVHLEDSYYPRSDVFQYAWMLGWLRHSEDRPDVKINVICPASEVHIRKVSPLRLVMASESKVVNAP
jgi:hypothetical protein